MRHRLIACALLLFAPTLAFLPGTPPAAAQTAPDLPIVNSAGLSLRQALSIASAYNLTLAQMQADADFSTATARSLQAQTRPSLSTTTYGTVGDSPNILTTSPGVMPQNLFSVPARGFADQNLMLMVPLSTGGRLQNNSAAARGEAAAAQLSLQASRLSVTQAVTEGYVNAVLQQALVDLAQARLTAEDEQVRVTQEKVATGRSAPVELLREQAEQADARQGFLAAQNNAALALVNLKAALGLSQRSQIALSDTLDGLLRMALPPATFQDAVLQADSHRPDLAAAQRLADAAQAALGAARGAYAPQVYGVAMGDVMTGPGTGRAGYTVGLTASLPLYDGGLRRADMDGAKARLARAQANAQQARQAVDQEVATDWLTLQTATAQRAAAQVGVDAAKQAYDLATLRYNAGKGIAAERLDALAAFTRAQGSLAQATANIANAQVRLVQAVGE